MQEQIKPTVGNRVNKKKDFTKGKHAANHPQIMSARCKIRSSTANLLQLNVSNVNISNFNVMHNRVLS